MISGRIRAYDKDDKELASRYYLGKTKQRHIISFLLKDLKETMSYLQIEPETNDMMIGKGGKNIHYIPVVVRDEPLRFSNNQNQKGSSRTKKYSKYQRTYKINLPK